MSMKKFVSVRVKEVSFLSNFFYSDQIGGGSSTNGGRRGKPILGSGVVSFVNGRSATSPKRFGVLGRFCQNIPMFRSRYLHEY